MREASTNEIGKWHTGWAACAGEVLKAEFYAECFILMWLFFCWDQHFDFKENQDSSYFNKYQKYGTTLKLGRPGVKQSALLQTG